MLKKMTQKSFQELKKVSGLKSPETAHCPAGELVWRVGGEGCYTCLLGDCHRETSIRVKWREKQKISMQISTSMFKAYIREILEKERKRMSEREKKKKDEKICIYIFAYIY